MCNDWKENHSLEGRSFYGIPKEVIKLKINGEQIVLKEYDNVFLIDESTDRFKEYSLEVRASMKDEAVKLIAESMRRKDLAALFIETKSGKIFNAKGIAKEIEIERGTVVGEKFIKIDYALAEVD